MKQENTEYRYTDNFHYKNEFYSQKDLIKNLGSKKIYKPVNAYESNRLDIYLDKIETSENY